MNKIIKILVGLLVVFFVLSAVKNTIAQSVLTGALSKAAHVPVKIGSTSVRFLSSSINIRNLRLNNPKGFPEKLMLQADRIFIDFDPSALFKGIAHFEDVKLDLKEVIVIKNRDGRLNVNALKPTEQEKERQKRTKSEDKPTKLQIDHMTLSIGRVVFKDYSQGGEPQVQVFNVNIQQREFRNIDNPSAVVNLIMFEALTRTTLGRLADMDLGVFKEGFSGSLDIVGDQANTLEKAAQGIMGLFK